MHECKLYKTLENGKVQCTACNHKCKIPLNKTGICNVRKNIDGHLVLLVYGFPVSENIDDVEKKPLFHFLPGSQTYSFGTVGCNFKCSFCQNYDISQVMDLFGKKTTAEKIVKKVIENKCESISYTYNEPTIWIEFAKDVAKRAKEKGLKNILVTNGYETKECMDFISEFINAMNIDLKSFSEEFYNCKARLKPVLDTIKYAKEKGVWIEITTLLIPGENDSMEELEKIAKFISSIDKNIPWHITRFFPMYEMTKKSPTEIQKLMEAEKIGKKYLNYVYVGNIQGEKSTFCPKCKKEVVKRFDKIEVRMKKGICPNCHEKISGVFN